MSGFQKHKEYFRLIAEIYATEDGLFKELPEDNAAAYVKIEVVYYLVEVTLGGQLSIRSFANPLAMGKDKKAGGPVKFGPTTLYTEKGPGSKDLELAKAYNPYLTATERQTADLFWNSLVKAYEKAGSTWYA